MLVPLGGSAATGRALVWKDYRTKISRPAYGCLAVKSRQGGGHIGFVVGRFPDGRLAAEAMKVVHPGLGWEIGVVAKLQLWPEVPDEHA